jgi:hypothetical protein
MGVMAEPGEHFLRPLTNPAADAKTSPKARFAPMAACEYLHLIFRGDESI